MVDPPPSEVPSHQLPIKSLSNGSATSPPSASGKSQIRSILLKKQASLDKFITRFHRVIYSREGLDITLLFAAEAARLIGALLGLLSKVPSLESARFLTALALILPKAISKASSTAAFSRFTRAAGETSERLQTLVIILEEWQILSRLWGILDIWMSTRGDNEQNGDTELSLPVSKLDRTLTILHRLSLASFHLCEATALLSGKNVLRWSPEVQDKLFGWAARSWGAVTCVELSRLLVDWYRKRHGDNNEDEEAWRKQWREEFLQNLAWAPLAFHWSNLPEGLLPEIVVALLGLYPSWGYMKGVWQDTA